MDRVHLPIAPERREWLQIKGQLLYGKYCGTNGEGICAENFAMYHLRLDEVEAVEDFVAFLQQQVAALQESDPEHRLPMTQNLLARVRQHLQQYRRQ